MAKVAKQELGGKSDGKCCASSSKGRKKAKASCKQRCKAVKGKARVRRCSQRNSKKKASGRKRSSATKTKKAGKSVLFGHYRKLKEKMKKNRHVHYADEEEGSCSKSR